MTREGMGEGLVVVGAVLAGGGVFLWLGLGAALCYAGAVLVVLGVMMALTTSQNEGGR